MCVKRQVWPTQTLWVDSAGFATLGGRIFYPKACDSDRQTWRGEGGLNIAPPQRWQAD